jgi:hypothetical protein
VFLDYLKSRYFGRGGAMKARRLIPFLGLLAAGCVTSQEVPLAPNAVRIDTRASGLLSVGSTTSVTMRKAAQATIDAGYTHFRLEQVEAGQGSQVGALVGTDYGNGLSTVTALHRPTSYEGVTVVMFHADEAGAQGAFNAADVLQKYQ